MGESLDMNNPKVSIIIPVYNTGKYVEEAVRSIMNQTLKDIEIIIINDGSTDNSLDIVNKLQAIDNRITIYSQENQGQSVARNLGIGKANGDYIYFMDSDDILDITALETCYDECVSEKLDFVFFDAEIFFEDKSLSLSFDYDRSRNLKSHVDKGTAMLEKLIVKQLYRVSVCLCLIRRSFLSDNQLLFYPGIIHEDELFAAQQYLLAERVKYIPEAHFKRRVRVNSTMTTSFSAKNIIGYFTVFAELKKFDIKENYRYHSILQQLLIYTLNPVVYRASVLPFSERLNVFRNCIKEGYIKYVTIKNLTVLLFPFTIRLKSYTKK